MVYAVNRRHFEPIGKHRNWRRRLRRVASAINTTIDPTPLTPSSGSFAHSPRQVSYRLRLHVLLGEPDRAIACSRARSCLMLRVLDSDPLPNNVPRSLSASNGSNVLDVSDV